MKRMAKDNTVLILGGLGVAAFLFRDQISKIFSGVGDAASGVGGAIQGAGNFASEVFREGGSTATYVLRDVSQLANAVTGTVSTALNAGSSVIKSGGGFVNDVINAFRPDQETARARRDAFGITDAANLLRNVGSEVSRDVVDVVRAPRSIANAVANSGENVVNWISSSTQDIRRWVSSVVRAPEVQTNNTPSSSTTRSIPTSLRGKSKSIVSSNPPSTALKNTTPLERLLGRSIPTPLGGFFR